MGSAALLCVLSLLEAVAVIALDNDSIKTAVYYWLRDSARAERSYGHISTWDTSGVTDMSYLFCGLLYYDVCNSRAGSFNDDISAWDTSGVRSMYGMFQAAGAFNQDISGWAVHNVKSMGRIFEGARNFNQDLSDWDVESVTNMNYMFDGALSFDQDLGWCLDNVYYNYDWFDSTPCESTSCGVLRGVCVMTDSKIRTAVAAWLSDPTAAEATYGHISMWETSGVTDMTDLFRDASSFNEDISAWDTSGVTTMKYMFYGASAFDQYLGWCVDDDVSMSDAFLGSRCLSTSCGVAQKHGEGLFCNVMDDTTIRTAVAAWFDDRRGAEATYGHISTWETGGVTDMSFLFCGYQHTMYCNTAAASFNEDIGAWNTSGVKNMSNMFSHASSFNQDIGDWPVHSVTDMSVMFERASAFDQDIGGWAVDSVTDMQGMFRDASAFDQDLGWCVDYVHLDSAFSGARCEPTSCGVVRCETKENDKDETPVAVIAGAAAAALLLAVGAFCFYRRRKASMTDKADEPSGANPEPTELPPPVVATSIKEYLATILIAPEAEEASTEQPAAAAKGWFSKGWFSATGPEGEPESAPFPPEAEDFAAAEEPPSLADWERRMNASEAAAEQGTGFQMTSALEGELEPEW